LDRIATLRDGGAVIRLRVPHGASERLGTAVLVDRSPQRDTVTLYFLTSAHLVLRNQGVQPVQMSDRWSEIDVLRIVTAHSDASPMAMRFETPNLDEAFSIAGFDGAERLVTISQRVTVVSPERVVGDRAAGLVGCVGAPAISEGSVFGIVVDCEAGRPPIVEPLSSARRFLTQKIPTLGGWGPLSH
jgi:hypothetical protein